MEITNEMLLNMFPEAKEQCIELDNIQDISLLVFARAILIGGQSVLCVPVFYLHDIDYTLYANKSIREQVNEFNFLVGVVHVLNLPVLLGSLEYGAEEEVKINFIETDKVVVKHLFVVDPHADEVEAKQLKILCDSFKE